MDLADQGNAEGEWEYDRCLITGKNANGFASSSALFQACIQSKNGHGQCPWTLPAKQVWHSKCDKQPIISKGMPMLNAFLEIGTRAPQNLVGEP
jgi:hypothetical protein